MTRHIPEGIAYLCLETPREAQASHIHSKEIIAGLRSLDVQTDFLALEMAGEGRQQTGVWRRILGALALQLKLVRKLHQYRAIYVRAHPLAFPIVLICKLWGVPVIHEVNGTFEDIYLAYPRAGLARPIVDAFMRRQYRWSTGLIAVTPGLADWLRESLAESAPRIGVITNGANTDMFHPQRKSELPLPARYVVFVGAQVPWHDTDALLEAMDHHEWPESVSIVLVGDAGDAARVRTAASRSPRIFIAGRLSYSDVGGVVAQAMAAVIPISNPAKRSSAAGAAPLKLFEALACGTPVIVSDLPYQADLVREMDAGLVFPVGDAPALARAVAAIDSNLEEFRAKSRSVAKVVHERHSWTMRALETKTFLQEVLTSVSLFGIV